MANRVIEAHNRQARALELRLQGHDYETIADTLGYSDRASAFKACQQVLKRREYEAVDEMRAIEGMKLDKLETTLWALAENGDLAAIDRIIKVMQRRANLYGLDLAGRLDVIAGGEVDLDGTVARIVAYAKGQISAPEDDNPVILEGDTDGL